MTGRGEPLLADGLSLKGLTRCLTNSSLARLFSLACLLRRGPGSGIAADGMKGSRTCVSVKQRDGSGAWQSLASGMQASM